MPDKTSDREFNIYVNIDDTLVRSYSTKRIPILATIEHIKKLKHQGATLYCWSSGGSIYAENTAKELGIHEIFTAFLPKPSMLIDDMQIDSWRGLIQIHPLSCQSQDLEDYRRMSSL